MSLSPGRFGPLLPVRHFGIESNLEAEQVISRLREVLPKGAPSQTDNFRGVIDGKSFRLYPRFTAGGPGRPEILGEVLPGRRGTQITGTFRLTDKNVRGLGQIPVFLAIIAIVAIYQTGKLHPTFWIFATCALLGAWLVTMGGFVYGVMIMVLLVAIGIGVSQMALTEIRLATFKPVAARIHSVAIDSDRDDDGTTYRPLVEYTYRIGKLGYRNWRVHMMNTWSSRSWAEGIASEYQPGNTVTAYYNPDDPQQSFLRRERDWEMLLFIAIPLIMLPAVIAQRRKSRASQG